MMNKEAVETLREEFCKRKLFCELYPDACQKENCDIYLAIEVLKGKGTVSPSIDTISRQAAILQLSHNKCGNDENDIAVQHDIETISHVCRSNIISRQLQ